MRQLLKYLLITFVVLLGSTATFATADAANFKDVPKSHRYYKEISTLADLGILQGYEDGTFKPSVSIKRSHVLAVLNRVPEIYIPPVRGMKKFKDLDLVHPYYSEFERFYRGGVIDGNGDYVMPEASVTRGQIAKIFYLYFDLKGNITAKGFNDVLYTHDKYAMIMNLASFGITTGDNGYFYPNRELSRQHLAVWLYRAIY